MAANKFNIKQNDTLPKLGAILQDEDKEPVDITGATVRFHMSPYNKDEVLIDEEAEIIDATEGKVAYQWQTGDTETPGRYRGEFEINFLSNGKQTHPNCGKDIEIIISKEIA